MSGKFLALILTALLSISVQRLQIREYEKPPTIGPPPNEIEIDYEERQYCSSIVRILGQILEKLLGITTNATKFCNKRSWIQDRSISDEPRGLSLNQWNRRDWWKRWLFGGRAEVKGWNSSRAVVVWLLVGLELWDLTRYRLFQSKIFIVFCFQTNFFPNQLRDVKCIDNLTVTILFVIRWWN